MKLRKELGLVSLEKPQGGSHIQRKSAKRKRALLSGAQEQDQRQCAQTETHEVPFEHQDIFFRVRVTDYWHWLPREIVRSLCPGRCPSDHGPGLLILHDST